MKLLMQDFTGNNVELLVSMLEQCGPFLIK